MLARKCYYMLALLQVFFYYIAAEVADMHPEAGAECFGKKIAASFAPSFLHAIRVLTVPLRAVSQEARAAVHSGVAVTELELIPFGTLLRPPLPLTFAGRSIFPSSTVRTREEATSSQRLCLLCQRLARCPTEPISEARRSSVRQ